MVIALNPYLQFRGNAREAMDFYHSIFGGELSVMTFGEGMGDTNPDTSNLIMHASLYLERGIHLMASDMLESMPTGSNGTISLSNGDTAGDDAKTLTSWWERLAEGGDVGMALEQSPWGDYFGQLTDQFGVSWMVNISGSET